MTHLLRSYIKEILSEALPSQHPAFKLEDLAAIGECLAEKLENIGFKISRSSTQFNDVCTFEIEKNKVYLVSIKKTSKNHITEDASVEYFRRDDPELAAFLKKVGNKNFSARKDQKVQSTNSSSNKSDSPRADHDESDDTHYGTDKETFKFKTNIEYTVTVYDKSKNGNTLFSVKQNLITSSGKNPKKDKNFDHFVDEICNSVSKKLKSI